MKEADSLRGQLEASEHEKNDVSARRKRENEAMKSIQSEQHSLKAATSLLETKLAEERTSVDKLSLELKAEQEAALQEGAKPIDTAMTEWAATAREAQAK